MEPDQLVDMGLWVAALGVFVSPPVIALVSNIGKMWPGKWKRVAAGFMAVIGSVIAYAATTDLSAVVLNDWHGLWLPLIAGVSVMVMGQYSSYKTILTPKVSLMEGLAGTFAPKDPGE